MFATWNNWGGVLVQWLRHWYQGSNDIKALAKHDSVPDSQAVRPRDFVGYHPTDNLHVAKNKTDIGSKLRKHMFAALNARFAQRNQSDLKRVGYDMLNNRNMSRWHCGNLCGRLLLQFHPCILGISPHRGLKKWKTAPSIQEWKTNVLKEGKFLSMEFLDSSFWTCYTNTPLARLPLFVAAKRQYSFLRTCPSGEWFRKQAQWWWLLQQPVRPVLPRPKTTINAVTRATRRAKPCRA